MTQEEQIKEALQPLVDALMNRLDALKQPVPETPKPDTKAIKAAEKAKTVNEIKDWSASNIKNY